jgi:hypothetical protein
MPDNIEHEHGVHALATERESDLLDCRALWDRPMQNDGHGVAHIACELIESHEVALDWTGKSGGLLEGDIIGLGARSSLSHSTAGQILGEQ